MAYIINNYHSGFRQALICKASKKVSDIELLTISNGKVVFNSDNTSYELDERGTCFFSGLDRQKTVISKTA